MVIKYKKILLISLFLTVMLSQTMCSISFAQGKYVSSIKWEKLNLSVNQQAKINILDMNWQNTSKYFIKQIIQDRIRLKYALTNPFASEQEIIYLQNRILINQNELSYKAMENFLQKKSVLTIPQRKKLQRMLLR